VDASAEVVDALERGRAAFASRSWAEAFGQLSAADNQSSLEPADLMLLAAAAYLIGREAESTDLWARAHAEYLRAGDTGRAIRCAFWLGFGLILRGEMATAGGWLSRGQRLLDDDRDIVERGYLLVPVAVHSLYAGDGVTAHDTFAQVYEIARRFDDPDLIALGQLGTGQGLVAQGQVVDGVRLLDEAMVTITTDQVSPMVVGLVYCAVIDACQIVFDLRRAQEWTAALTRWCDSQPDLVPYRGQCLVHRVQVMQLHGAWPDALTEAQRACENLEGRPALGMARYEQAELYRLRGEAAMAEHAYEQASDWGHDPQPGLALLRLGQGNSSAAEAAIRRAISEPGDPRRRAQLLRAHVEIMLATKDIAAARRAADELMQIADVLDAALIRTIAACAHGAVLIAENDARAALSTLRGAWSTWQELDAPYEAARTRVLIGQACRELGDEDGARMEFHAASTVFEQLGAAPDLARATALMGVASKSAGPLTPREVEVLRLVATGKTNRAIAADLFLSEKTVARHISNIFLKLNVSSRSAATAYAYEHDLM
jgi:DNA-binding CsgD family transcriptional regulator